MTRTYTLLEKLEFWLATALYGIAVTAIFSEGGREEGALFGIYYLKDILIMSVLYFSFLLLNLIIIPGIRLKDSLWINSLAITVIIVASVFLIPELGRNFILILLAGYFLIKFGIIFLWKRLRAFREEKGSFYTGILMAVVFYLLLMFFLFGGNAELLALGIPGILLPFAIILYSYSFRRLIPGAMEKKHPFRNFLWKVLLVLLAAAVPLGILAYVLLQDEELPFVINMMNFFFQFLFTVPLAWFTYKRHISGKEEIKTLQKELGQSTAKFDFLRSQINPHFLFNALNTLYGTAIQENAERTGEGIQQLGDMMRFMLHENMQEKISLAREIEYLQNYINLQRLRTDPNPNMTIHTEIQEQENYFQISPMLLIPFVENAFKHGISFRHPSHIKISLEQKAKKFILMCITASIQDRRMIRKKTRAELGFQMLRKGWGCCIPGSMN
ncbi:sensor histidine kinase [Antarcticibacterium sp. 1MA-6-2]|uniref:sensor histidine kinase n=1 Tax=Antarcticibacterium sp. 1MA-6-2 TaxID=2908210 RepID=UPI001F1C15FD|nr:sensor histidine kinase [Antarcticibacterium sp. 1MA-6-2]UJH92357.1 sensor histidine kinase [Antarcticibacterium sp. 1MA-6-2]